MFETLGQYFESNVVLATRVIAGSISKDDYNALPIVPLIPFELIFGPSRLSYILAIANIAVLPSAALMAWVAERTSERRSWPRFLISTALLAGVHVLWAPVLRGLPDVMGIAIACCVLILYIHKPREYRLLRIVGLGTLLALLILTRRWYLFWAASFFPAAVLAHIVAVGAVSPKRLFGKFRELAIAGAICAVVIVAVASRLLVRVASTDYVTAYAGFGPELAGGAFAQVVHQFGLALLGAGALGLGWLAARTRSRELGVLLIVQAVVPLALFTHVQGFLGVQHFYLLLPSVGIGIAALVLALWNAPWHLAGRIGGIAVLAAVVLLSSLSVFVGNPAVSAIPLMPAVQYQPLVRPDLREIDRLLDKLSVLRPKLVYVAASSEVLNWSTLKVACRVTHPTLCQHIAVTADVDARDGFPVGILMADTVVVATPNQYHVRPQDQQVVGLLADHIRDGTGLGSSFEPIAGEFPLKNGVHAQIYRRVSPLRHEDVQGLSDELVRSYPARKSFFKPPTVPADGVQSP